MSAGQAIDKAPRMKFSHLGLVVSDLEAMQDFYTRVLGFELTDKGTTGSGATMAFLTLDPAEHHQVFLVDGKPDGELPANRFMPGTGPVLHHLSFRLASLQQLRRMFDRLGAESDRKIDTVTHGVCWALYTTDPEGNSLEFFADTPWYIEQPFLKPIDFSKSDDVLFSETEEMCRAAPGFRAHADFNAELARRVPVSAID
ncbi:MAG: VOC family protein [Defluviicoccus sp.]|nr:VOC family protein [Defluviicoccus sp.]